MQTLESNAPTVNRSQWLESALDAARHDLDEDRFAAAVGHFREALALSHGIPSLRAAVTTEVEEQSERLLPRNWRVAQTILQETVALEPSFAVAADLNARLERARHDEFLTNVIHQADRLEIEGKTAEARLKLEGLLAVYPDETRIQARISAFDRPVALAAKIEVPAGEITPSESELDTAVTPNALPGTLGPWSIKIRIAKATWDTVKNVAALAAATAMLATAGLLIWHRFSPHESERAKTPAAVRHASQRPIDYLPQSKSSVLTR